MTTTSSAAPAQPPTLNVTRHMLLDMPAPEVWQLLSDFGHVENWHPAVARSQMLSGGPNTPGAVRKLTFMDGGTLEETLIAHEPQNLRLSYTITAGAFPVSDYTSTLSVQSAEPGKSRVTWSGNFSRAAGKDDRTATQAVEGVYDTGLQSLKTIVADRLAIQRIIGFYADGGTRGDAAVVSQAFHPSATMKFIRAGALVDEPIEAYYSNYIKPGVLLDRTVTTDYIDIRGTAASARLTLDYPTHQFIDYFNLLKIDGQWRVVSKIFHRAPKP